MTILVFSDTHRDVQTMENVIKKMKPDRVFHLGDHLADAQRIGQMFPGLPMDCVKGNCDSEWADSKKTVTIGKLRFFLTHGDLYFVKNGLSELVRVAQDRQADLAIFGHTHIPNLTNESGLILLNPGRSGKSFSKDNDPTFAVIETDGKDFTCRIEHVR